MVHLASASSQSFRICEQLYMVKFLVPKITQKNWVNCWWGKQWTIYIYIVEEDIFGLLNDPKSVDKMFDPSWAL